MEITNLYNLPEPVVSAIRNDTYKKVGDISVTGLLRPPQMRVLEKRHWAKIIQDAVDFVWRLWGQAVHAIFERADTTNHLAEERMVEDVLGWKVSGQADLLSADGVLSDYKATKVFSFLLGEKPEWTAQLNIYRWFYSKRGFEVRKLQIVAILLDWSRREAEHDSNYPQAPIITVEIPLWSIAETEAQVIRLVRLHQEAEKLSDDNLPNCTAQERWERPTTYAVKKNGNKRAFRVLESLREAEDMAASTGMVLEPRPGESIRCERFCPVKAFCNQYAKSHKKELAA